MWANLFPVTVVMTLEPHFLSSHTTLISNKFPVELNYYNDSQNGVSEPRNNKIDRH